MHNIAGTHHQACAPFELPGLGKRYEILDLLDRGGMSIVYKAHDKVLDRVVALKTIKTARLEEKQVVHFQDEARAICSLKHEGIVRVLDFGVMKAGQPYLVLDFLEGQTLAQHVGLNGRLPLAQALSVIAQICDAMSHAHAHGVIHRDIKPSNIILLESKPGEYTARVIDFGIAVVLENPARGMTLTPSGSIVGSPAYMSPEQIRQSRLDARTDIYSLGCVLFEAITRRRPFSGDSSLQIMQKHLTSPPPPLPSSVCSDDEILSSIDAVICRALEKDPESRYQSIDDFHDEIVSLMERVDAISRPADRFEISRSEIMERNKTLRDSQIIKMEEKSRATNLLTLWFVITLVLCAIIVIGIVTFLREGIPILADMNSSNDVLKPPPLTDIMKVEFNDVIFSTSDTAIVNSTISEFDIDLERGSPERNELLGSTVRGARPASPVSGPGVVERE